MALVRSVDDEPSRSPNARELLAVEQVVAIAYGIRQRAVVLAAVRSGMVGSRMTDSDGDGLLVKSE
jgi:hypothetical protein